MGMSRTETSSMYNRNRLKLGLFGFNCDGGMAITAAPDRWHPTWENNIAVARLADGAGLEFLLPIGRWRGYGGKADFQGVSLETVTWACGILASTTSCTVFGTIHAPMIHPIVAAKQMATVDSFSGGRFGVNLVCGWNQDEFEMFGKEQLPHDERYEYGQEWLDVVRTIWREERRVDFHGRYFDLHQLIGRPPPHEGAEPVLMNAGYSQAGRAFAERNCAFLLTSLVDIEQGRGDVAEVREAAQREYGRDINLVATAYVVCRPTAKEANDFHDYYAKEHADWEAADHLMELAGIHAQFFPPEHYQQFRERFAGGHGMYPVIGDPDHVADELERIADAGFAAAAISFFDYVAELPLFRDEVLPRLEARAVRTPGVVRAA
jgi:alkanesulfonate monooxygenase SsuD/methylene tetrahydromethanopterin reductase-like flavin-dependent oxidoreductase (luciferase family)